MNPRKDDNKGKSPASKQGNRIQNHFNLFDLVLDNFLIELYNVLGHGLLSPVECLCCNFILPEQAVSFFLFLSNYTLSVKLEPLPSEAGGSSGLSIRLP